MVPGGPAETDPGNVLVQTPNKRENDHNSCDKICMVLPHNLEYQFHLVDPFDPEPPEGRKYFTLSPQLYR